MLYEIIDINLLIRYVIKRISAALKNTIIVFEREILVPIKLTQILNTENSQHSMESSFNYNWHDGYNSDMDRIICITNEKKKKHRVLLVLQLGYVFSNLRKINYFNSKTFSILSLKVT